MSNATAIPKENNAELGMVEFLGARLTVATEGEHFLVALKPISDSIGLSWAGQLERIKRDDVLSACIRVIRTQLVGDIQSREAVFLPLEMLNGWLFGIDVRRCRQEIRPTLTCYKRECYSALAAYWSDGIAVRKHDRDTMTVIDELIGMTEVNVIKGLIRDKAKVIPIDRRRGFQLAMHNRLHTRFNVPRVELIPAQQFDAACNFVAAYALEGEWLPKEEKRLGTFVLDMYAAQEVSLLIHYADWVGFRWEQGISDGLRAMNPKFHASTKGFFWEMKAAAQRLERSVPELLAYFHREDSGYRPHEALAKGRPVGHPAD